MGAHCGTERRSPPDARTIAARGISIEGLRKLLQLVADTLQKNPSAVLTSELRQFVVEQTLGASFTKPCPYHEKVEAKYKGEPAAFVSYWSGSSFKGLVDALEVHFSNARSTAVWVDLIALNQHEACLESDLKTLPDVISEIGMTLLFLDSGECLRRLWCAFEIFFSMPGRPGTVQKQVKVLEPTSDWHNAMVQVFTADSRACTAYFEEDQKALQRDLSMGAKSTNALGVIIRKVVLEGCSSMGSDIMPSPDTTPYAAYHAACVLQAKASEHMVAAKSQQSRFDDAIDSLKKASSRLDGQCTNQEVFRDHTGTDRRCIGPVLRLRVQIDLVRALAGAENMSEACKELKNVEATMKSIEKDEELQKLLNTFDKQDVGSLQAQIKYEKGNPEISQ